MNTTKLSENFIVSGQLAVSDLQEIKNLGIKTIICNRPDKEDYNQVSFNTISEEASKFGIKAFHIPITVDTDPLDIKEAYNSLKNEILEPVIAYCRSGSRSAALFNLIQ